MFWFGFFLKFFWNFFEIFLEDLFRRIFWRNFLGEIFLEGFFGGSFWEIFLWGFFWEDLFARNSLITLELIDLFVKILVFVEILSHGRRKEGGSIFNPMRQNLDASSLHLKIFKTNIVFFRYAVHRRKLARLSRCKGHQGRQLVDELDVEISLSIGWIKSKYKIKIFIDRKLFSRDHKNTKKYVVTFDKTQNMWSSQGHGLFSFFYLFHFFICLFSLFIHYKLRATCTRLKIYVKGRLFCIVTMSKLN